MTRLASCTRWMAVLLTAALLTFSAGCGSAEGRKERHVERGREFMAERNYAKARLEFRNALQIDPQDAGVRVLAGVAAEKLGNYQDAVKMYRVALAADETLELPRAHLAILTAYAGLPDDALELLKPGLDAKPQSVELLNARAVALLQKGDVAGARRDAEQAVALQPANAAAVGTLSSLMWRAGERTEAAELLRKQVASDPGNVETRVLLGQVLLAVNEPAAALEQFQEVVSLDPQDLNHRYRLAQLLVEQGKPDQAIEVLRDAVKDKPDSVEARLGLLQLLASHRSPAEVERAIAGFREERSGDLALLLGVAQFHEINGNDSGAEQLYREVISEAGSKPQGTEARTRLAALLMRDGREQEAISLIDAVLEANPADAEALAVRADAAMQRGDAEAAIADLRAALGAQPDSVTVGRALARAYLQNEQPELAEQTLRSVLQANPTDVMARFALAQFFVDTGRLDQARPVMERLVSEQPNNLLALEGLARLQRASKDGDGALKTALSVQAMMPGSAKGYLMAGQAEEAARRFDAARRSFERALAVDPESPEPVIALVRLDVLENHPERALARLDENLSSRPTNALLLGLRGDLLMAMKRPEEAVDSYSAAVKATPTWTEAHRSLARAYEAAGLRTEAVAVLEDALVKLRGSPWVAMDLARLYERLGRIDNAIDTYQRLIDRSPRQNGAVNNLAMLLANHKTDARSLDRALKLSEQFAGSDFPPFLDTHGWVLYKRGQYPEAVAVLEKAVTMAPSAKEFRYHLGMAQLGAGNRVAAREHLAIAVAGEPDYVGVDEARSALKSLM